MTGKAEKRRPMAVAIFSLVVIGAALVGPVVFGSRQGAPLSGGAVHADSREMIPIGTPLEIFSAPRIAIERGNVGVVGENAGGSTVGKVFRALVLGGGSDLILGSARITVDMGARVETVGAIPADVAEPLAPLVAALAGFKFRSLALVDAAVAFKSAAGETYAIDDLDAEIVTDRNGLVKAKGRMEYRGEAMTFDVAFAVPQSPGDEVKDASVRVRADIQGRLLTTSFDGRLALGERGKLTAEHAELSMPSVRKAADWLGVAWPEGRGLGPFTAKGFLTVRTASASFEQAEFSLDGNAATGALTLKSGAERPTIEGTLAFTSLDIAPYLPPSSASALERASEWAWGLKLPGFAEPSFLRATDADIRISAANVMKGAQRLGRMAASVSVKSGKLFGELAELDLEQGGKGEAQFTVDMTGSEPRYSVRADLDDIDLASVSAGRLVPFIEGAGDINFNVTARGASAADVLETVSGEIALEMPEGARLGFDVDALAEASRANPPRGWGAAAARSTALSALTARFIATNGVLTTEAMEATAADRLISVRGTADIDKAAVDLVLSLGQLDATADLKSATPIGAYRIHGPWAAPAISPVPPSKDARSMSAPANPG